MLHVNAQQLPSHPPLPSLRTHQVKRLLHVLASVLFWLLSALATHHGTDALYAYQKRQREKKREHAVSRCFPAATDVNVTDELTDGSPVARSRPTPTPPRRLSAS